MGSGDETVIRCWAVFLNGPTKREEKGMPIIEGFDKLALVPEERITEDWPPRDIRQTRYDGKAGACSRSPAST